MDFQTYFSRFYLFFNQFGFCETVLRFWICLVCFRSTKKAPANHRLECVCQHEEAPCWGLCSFRQVISISMCPMLFRYLSCDDPNSFHFQLRDGKGQLLLGIRRANRQQPALSSSVISSDSMHIGVLAAAAHANANNSPFTIFYNPRWLIYVSFLSPLTLLNSYFMGNF